MLRNLTDLESDLPESRNIYYKDIFYFYKHRPNNLENMSLRKFVGKYERAYQSKNSKPEIYDKAPYIRNTYSNRLKLYSHILSP